MTLSFRTQQESKELSSLPRKTLTPSQSLEERLRRCGNSLKRPKIKKRKLERSFKASRTRSPSFTKSLNKDLVSLLVKTIQFISSLKDKRTLKRKSN